MSEVKSPVATGGRQCGAARYALDVAPKAESKISWVKFCEDIPSEVTGADPKAADFFAGMQSNQG